jgi:hypothetical protein
MNTKLFLFVLLTCTTLFAQDYPRKEINLERLADELFGFQELDLNYEDLYENLALLLAHPLNINKATAEELRFIHILTEEQLQQFLRYREENGNLLSIYELQAIPGFDLSTIYQVAPFFMVEDMTSSFNASLWKRIIADGNNYFIFRYERTLESKRGFTEIANENQRFVGSEDKIYWRLRSSRPGDFSIGITTEKDAGERTAWNPGAKQYGFDYTSFHVQVLNKGKIKNLIVGDFQSQFGQGLLLGNNFGFGKGSETITTIRRSNIGFLPYTSVNETGYMRGVAVTYGLQKNIFLSAFYSNAWRDATLANDSTDHFAAAFQTTGLHRNQAELSRRQTLREMQQGFILSYRKRHLDGGLLVNRIHYDVPIQRNPSPYNQFAFSGNTLSNVGFYLNFSHNNFTWFSEAGKTLHGGIGLLAGLLGSLSPRLDIALHFRHYQPDFQSPYANAFAEGTLPQNEQGMYWGWKYRWNRKYSVAGYTDLFRFPWLRFRNYAPSDGHEFLFRFNYQPSRHVLVFVQAREESKPRNVSGSESNLYQVQDGTKRNYWLNCDYGLGQKLRLKSRAQFSTYTFNGTTTSGMTLAQDVSYDFGKLSVATRYALFDTDDFDNRQYLFERDVWLAYSMPALSGRGIRSYVLVQYSVSKRITVWLRYAHTRFTDRETIGSGADTIDGNMRNDIKGQLRFRI